jgi:alpha-tubulin suppressor-like RCC1 family protein
VSIKEIAKMPTQSEIQTCINNLNTGSESIDFITLAAETSNANTGISFSVATIDDLPDLETTKITPGQIIFVESIGVPVVNTENKWKGLDGRILRKDFDVRSLFLWGSNTCGGLGDGTTIGKCSPVREISLSADWCQVSAMDTHSIAVKTSGEIWVWGQAYGGRLGDGTTVNKCSPVRELCSATNWKQVSAGGGHNITLKTSGEIWSWGRNFCGRLGDGTTENRCSPVREISSSTDWCQVCAGYGHNSAMKTSGEIWSWGLSQFGQLGDGTALTTRCSPVREFCSATDWCQVSAGNNHTSAIKTTGQIWSWGRNSGTFDPGALGDGTLTDRCSPVREFCSAIDWCFVGAGVHTVAIKTSGELWAWGRNNYCGSLGDGTATNRCSPVREISSSTDWCFASAFSNTLAIKTSGQLWAWGNNVCGRLGDGTTIVRCSPVREISLATDWCQVKVGRSITAAIRLKI